MAAAFISTQGSGSSHLFFIKQAISEAAKVAREPKMTSITPRKLNMLASAQPIKSPGTAAGVKNGSTQSASETRSCIIPSCPKLKGATAIVSTK